MRLALFTSLVAASMWAVGVGAKAVFAHFMVTNTAKYEDVTWLRDIALAKRAHIDAFALNMQYGDKINEKAISDVFRLAEVVGGFQLFFSFDYAGGGPWPKKDVIAFLTKYSSSSAYFRHNGQPFVSTFEGPGQADDWHEIKSTTGCFFVPDWSSLGAKSAMAAGGGVADGLFSWAAWPWGNYEMDTYVDASYEDYLGGKPYMMPVSPWFYTNLPGFNKNWLWRGDHVWFDRWQQIAYWQPEWVEIISWNDYGESHHIGPVLDCALDAFTIGEAPFNYVLDHDAWRNTLPFTIDMYKNGFATIEHELVTMWYRLNSKFDCSDGGTTANTASQFQLEFKPSVVLDDSIFYTALLASNASVTVSIGGAATQGDWLSEPDGGVGIYHGSVPIQGRTGKVQLSLTRNGQQVGLARGDDITTSCNEGYNNYNAYVTGATLSGFPVKAKTPNLSDQVCIQGTGTSGFAGLCAFTCSYGYCPHGACRCMRMGSQRKFPKASNVNGYPAEGRSASYAGLCAFACNYGYCPSSACDKVQHPLVIPTVSPFLPPSFGCSHGFCPVAVCNCKQTGALNFMAPLNESNATPVDSMSDDHGLCAFACARGYCPDVCVEPSPDDANGVPPWPQWLDPSLLDEDGDWINDDSVGLSCNQAPATLDELVGMLDASQSAPICWDLYAAVILADMLDQALDDYADVVQGYDGIFGYYVDWVKESITPSLERYMALDDGPGNRYFSCEWSWGTSTGSGACPPSKQFWKASSEQQSWSVTYTLQDADGFYAAILRDLGIEKDWVKFGDDTNDYACADQGDRPVHGGASAPCRHVYHRYYQRPMKSDSVTVANPKDLITAALPSITALQDTLTGTILNMGLQCTTADTRDIVTAASMPIFMLQDAVAQMQSIKDIGAEAKAEKKKELILGILAIVLFLIPFVGEAADAVGITSVTVSRIALLVSELGNAAISIVDIIDDPLSAPFLILATLAGAGSFAGRGEKAAYEDAARARRAMGPDSMAKFSDAFRAKDGNVQKIINACVKY